MKKEVRERMKNRLLILILQNIVLFPNQEVKLEFSNDISKNIIDRAIHQNGAELVLVASKNEEGNVLGVEDIESIGVLVKIKNAIDLPNGKLRVALRGTKRIKITNLKVLADGLIEVETTAIENPLYNLDEELAYSRKLKEMTRSYVEINRGVSNTILDIIKNVTNLSKLTDMISASLEFDIREKMKLFKETNHYDRAKMLVTLLSNEVKSIKLENKIDEEIHAKFEKSEKEIIIREKIKMLSDELGVDSDKMSEAEIYKKTISELKVDEKIRQSMYREVRRFELTMDNSPEYGSLRSHLEFITSLPWNKSSKGESDIEKIDEQLNGLHYGLSKAKERIEEYMVLKKKNKNLHSPILCLIGPPGTGKTTFARELASSTHREFVKVSVGGLNDASELIGHRRTYIGAGAGKIMEGIRKSGVNNPIILIDEIDKMVKDYKGDPSSVLLEILDQNQNREFVDNYVQEPFDLSNVLFILTANDESKIPRALYDRLEVIEVASYTLFDKIEIAKNYTLPRLGKEYGFDHTKIKISETVIAKIVEEYTREAGVRDLERKISTIIRKILIKGLDKTVTIKESDLEKYLGNDTYREYENYYETSGVVNVPAFTSSGGCLINVEVALYNGGEKILTTGSLGKVMQESAMVAVSYLKDNCKQFKIDKKSLSETMHVHALDGATPKDGPSAGLGIEVAILSAILDKKVPNYCAFTGEISLKGRILKVGGIKEKLISAYNAGIKKMYIPRENEADLGKVPKKVFKDMEVKTVNCFTEVYEDIFN